MSLSNGKTKHEIVKFFFDLFVIALISLIRQRTVLSIGWSLCIFSIITYFERKVFFCFRGCTSRLDNLFSEDSDFLFLPFFCYWKKEKHNKKNFSRFLAQQIIVVRLSCNPFSPSDGK